MQLSRRNFLAASAAMPFALRSLAATPIPRWVFIGNGTTKGIFRASWNPSTGQLGNLELAASADRPNFLALHPALPVLYTVNEATGAAASVSSFRLDRTRGTLTQTSRLSSHGDGPCYVSVDHTGQNAFAANYAGGSFAAFSIGATGELTNTAATLDCRHNPVCGALGPNKDRQDAAHMHCAVVSPSNDFILACNLGEDAIEVFPLHPGAPHPLGDPIRIAARPGSGPRHLAFHPNRRWLYCIHELDSTIDLYDWTPRAGETPMRLRQNSAVSTLPGGVALPGNTACEIIVSDDGRRLYSCTRGNTTNIISVHRIDPATGLLIPQQHLSCGGDIPRYIAFDPTRRWLLCTNQGSNTITVFAHDPATGRIHEHPQIFSAEIPMFVLFI
jgi:6-phosphogluconolactonase